MTLPYELAVELKSAGFPQYNAYQLSQAEKNGGINPEYVKIPTLEELVEACEEGGYLKLWVDYGVNGDKIIWHASTVDGEAEGPTPLIAVARLWLAGRKT